MKKEGRDRILLKSFILCSIILGIFFIYSAEGLHIIRSIAGSGVNNITGPVNEDVTFQYNISVNNTEVTASANITVINITLPANFNFTTNTNLTNQTSLITIFANTTYVLSWNATNGLVWNTTLNYFLFNATASEPGYYNISITTVNVSGFFNTTNISVTVNDTTVPSNITYQGLTPTNGSFLAGDSIFLNISAYDNGAIQSLLARLGLANSTSAINSTNLTTISNISQELKLNNNYTINFTGLSDGLYIINVTVNDTRNNINYSETRTIVLDKTVPVPSYDSTTEGNGTFLARNYTIVNLSMIEVNLNNTNVSLFNATGSFFSSNLTRSNVSFYINFTHLLDGVYFFNATINDSAGNRNLSLLTRTVIIDTTVPVPSYGTQADGNASFVARPFVLVNISVVEANFNFTNVSLYNATGSLNNTVLNRTISQLVNFSGLSDGVYFFNATVNDSAGFSNNTIATRTITVDTTVPVPSYGIGTDANNTFTKRNFVIVNVSITETNLNYTNVTLHNSTGGPSASNFSYNSTLGSLYINFTGISSGVYFFNTTVNDSAGNRNLSLQTRTITVDTNNPSVTQGDSDSTSTVINASITISDSTTTINGTCTVDRSGATVTGTGSPQRVSESGLTCSTTYTYVVTCVDQAGNAGGATKLHTTLGCDTGGSGGTGGGAAGATPATPTPTPTVWTKTIVIDEKQLSNGYENSLQKNERINLTIKNEKHYVGVLNVSNKTNEAVLEIASTPQKITLRVGETKKVEVNNDKYYDLKVTLQKIIGDKATVNVASIFETIPEAESSPGASNVAESPPEEAPEEETASSSFSSKTIWIIGGVAVLVIVILIFIIRRNRTK